MGERKMCLSCRQFLSPAERECHSCFDAYEVLRGATEEAVLALEHISQHSARWSDLPRVVHRLRSALPSGEEAKPSLGPNHQDGCDGNRWRYSGRGYNRVRVCACGAEDHAPEHREEAKP